MTISICVFFKYSKLDQFIVNTRDLTKINIIGTFKYVQKNKLQSYLENRLRQYDHIDINKLEDALNKMPWVDYVEIKVHESNLVLSIKELYPIAIFNNDKLISNNGTIFAYNSVISRSSLPLIYGDEYNINEIIFWYLTISYMLKKLKFTIKSLKSDNFSGYQFMIDNVQVNIGCHNMIKNVQQFIILYNSKLRKNWSNIKKVDMRNLSGGSITWNYNTKLK